ncbi:MAG: Pentapeptide repeat-containing protein [Mucilaginibacter sp.]|nr:Pentapeptide repeat-containing protein [Mucilaginibacter sp.]
MESKSPQTEPANEHLEILEARKILNVKWSNLTIQNLKSSA